MKDYPDLWAARERDKLNFRYPNGESYQARGVCLFFLDELNMGKKSWEFPAHRPTMTRFICFIHFKQDVIGRLRPIIIELERQRRSILVPWVPEGGPFNSLVKLHGIQRVCSLLSFWLKARLPGSMGNALLHVWDWWYLTWVFPKILVPKIGWFIMENLIKMDDLEVPQFSETSTWTYMGWLSC